MQSTVYVYGVMRAADARELESSGVADAAVRAVAHGGLAALVSDVGERLAGGRPRDARALARARGGIGLGDGPAGAVRHRDGERRPPSVERLLEPNADRLTAALASSSRAGPADRQGRLRRGRLAARRGPARAGGRAAARARPGDAPSDAGYYRADPARRAVAAEVEQRREADSGLALERLEPLAVAAKPRAASAATERRSTSRSSSSATGSTRSARGRRARRERTGSASSCATRPAAALQLRRRRASTGRRPHGPDHAACSRFRSLPCSGTVWIAERIQEQAEASYYDETRDPGAAARDRAGARGREIDERETPRPRTR